ncbi:MAG: hypothetical protein QME96_10245 [Myxococcota bacterium]|nr:hypothetical protein [Myxococcota bacterium]
MVLVFAFAWPAACARPRESADAPAPRSRVQAPPLDDPDASLLPDDLVAPWTADGAPRSYLRDELHMLVNGGDAVFHRYGVLWALRRAYRSGPPDGPAVRIELFAFPTPQQAAARYGHEDLEAGGAAPAVPMPHGLAGKADTARLDMDQLRLLRGRFLAFLRYEHDAAVDPTRLIEEAEGPLTAFGAALAGRIDAATTGTQEGAG